MGYLHMINLHDCLWCKAKLHKSTMSMLLNSHNCQGGRENHRMVGRAKYEQVSHAVAMRLEYECYWVSSFLSQLCFGGH